VRVTLIVNPVAGPRRRRRDAHQAVRALAERGADVTIGVTSGRGHAARLTRAALDAGTDLVVAWGGDGTVNEVGGVLAGSTVPLGIVPAGTGNGLARDLGLALDAERALIDAAEGRTCPIDAGRVEDRLFFSVAGTGLDAAVARAFDASAGHSLPGYVAATVRTLLTYSPREYVIRTDGEELAVRALLVATANASQYGYRATIAPSARLDDGRLNLVIVQSRGRLADLWRARRLFDRSLFRDAGVTGAAVTEVEISSDIPIAFHVDGESLEAGRRLTIRVVPGALGVRVPRDAHPRVLTGPRFQGTSSRAHSGFDDGGRRRAGERRRDGAEDITTAGRVRRSAGTASATAR